LLVAFALVARHPRHLGAGSPPPWESWKPCWASSPWPDIAVVNSNDRFANFHDPNRLSFCAIKEERDCYAVSLVLGVDRFAVAQADRPPREGGAPQQPAIERLRLLIPGFSVK